MDAPPPSRRGPGCQTAFHRITLPRQVMTLRWGKVVSVETLEDLQVLDRAQATVAAAGVTGASDAPISDMSEGDSR